MARDPITAHGGRPRPAPPRRRSRASLIALAALAALALRAADAAASPAELPPWDPTGAQATPSVPAAPPASSPPAASPPPAATRPTSSRPAASPSASPPAASPPATRPPSAATWPSAAATPPSASPPSASPPAATPPGAATSPAESPASAAPSSSAATAPAASPPSALTSPVASSTPAAPPPAAYSDELPPPPRDPNDAAFMRPPNNQFQGLPPRTRPDIRRGWSARRRIALTLAPAFAQFRLPFQGGRPARLPGAGFNIELDVQIWRWIWLRGHGTYSGHPVDEVRMMNADMQVMETAPRGTIHATGFGAGPVFALDLGRFLPLIEVGLGGLRTASPRSEIKGQRGAACNNGQCDIGLKCSPANVCEPSILPDLYFGLAVDLLIRRHISLGVQFRYYSRLARGELTNFPVYLLGTVRLSVRF